MGAGLFPENTDDRAALDVAGVYLRVKMYEGGRLVGYVGQSKHLLQRFDQHLTRILSLNVTIRDETGLPACGTDRLALFNALDKAGPLAFAEARRTRFYFARAEDGFDVDYLTLLEALLKARAEQNLGSACENIQSIAVGAFDHDISVTHDFSLLAADAAAVVQSVIGVDSIHLQAAEEAFDHAD
jgi:hypothetical protein